MSDAAILEELRAQRGVITRLLERLSSDSAPVAVTKVRAARELEVSVKTVERMVRAGEIRQVLVRGMPRIPFAELLRVARVRDERPAPPSKSNARAEAEALRKWKVP